MTRIEKIKRFWESKEYAERLELYTTYLGYVPIESITSDDEVFIYDCWRRDIKGKFEQPLLNKIEERETFIKELFFMAMHPENFAKESTFLEISEKYNKIIT